MQRVAVLAAAVAVVFVTGLQGTAAGPGPKAIPLRKAAEAQVSKARLGDLCRYPCDTRTAQAYTDAAGKIYVIDATPILIVSDPADTTGEKARYWDFSEYEHSYRAADSGGDKTLLTVYPALYPAGGGQYAVAVVATAHESYSGGGAAFEVADFLVLEPRKNDEWEKSGYRALHHTVPFSCNKMIRACFSEKDYNTLPHCHDETFGTLTIHFTNTEASKIVWQFIWNESVWPANTPPRNREPATSSPFTLDGGKGPLPANAPFCGGPAG